MNENDEIQSTPYSLEDTFEKVVEASGLKVKNLTPERREDMYKTFLISYGYVLKTMQDAPMKIGMGGFMNLMHKNETELQSALIQLYKLDINMHEEAKKRGQVVKAEMRIAREGEPLSNNEPPKPAPDETDTL